MPEPLREVPTPPTTLPTQGGAYHLTDNALALVHRTREAWETDAAAEQAESAPAPAAPANHQDEEPAQ